MSFSDKSGLSAQQKIGCLVYMAVGTSIVLFGLVGAAIGDCADGPGSSCKDGLVSFLLFPGSLILVVLGGLLMLLLFTRNER